MTDHDMQTLSHENTRLKDEIKRQQDHIHYLENELSEIRSLKTHMKKFAHKKVRALDSKVEALLESQKTFQPIVPPEQGDILTNARRTDQQNLAKYNQVFAGSPKIRAYRKAKRTAKRLVGRRIGIAQ